MFVLWEQIFTDDAGGGIGRGDGGNKIVRIVGELIYRIAVLGKGGIFFAGDSDVEGITGIS